MFRLIICFLYISGFLIYSIPQLARIKKVSHLPVEEHDKIAHQYPKRFSKTFMKLTGSQISVEGLDLIPEGPVVFIANHESDFDIPVLLGAIDKPFGFVSKIEVKKVPILSSWLDAINCILIDRKDRQQALNSMQEGANLLKQGHSLVKVTICQHIDPKVHYLKDYKELTEEIRQLIITNHEERNIAS